ncbi:MULTISPECIES: DEAD/DEAH box helicase [Flavobacterium]|jgi:superfamily II DNA or RNA helicase|uniref:DEAD/DEAH box helicase n=2 Tax=Flavobacterium TaxID=237 RepID=A0A1S1J4J8_9FLAO|nr:MULTISPECIES: DEAD/DEAH box helicase [Flavobacterium]MCC9020024.1 DEAD/DEAH box helicase [Flavobacterium sp. F-126]MDL2144510.1 DEAD/DEAH box helicase [Flavobacterium tructae]OHT44116.1 DEAD/DEAH box helicase [Flavobacterium tructae]OXB20245.1 DEAD/DEAH box helicase [Flavobacterium tructae]OXB22978.1 DEAD/DEAH box helicase [Flavobacterium tructae]
MSQNTLEIEREEKKELYAYQKGDIDAIFDRLDNAPPKHHLLYQLPTGGGKTVIFSEIVRRYLANNDKKVVVLTHRIELCKQTSKMLKGFGVSNKIINSKVKELPDQNDFSCFVAMVETLKNRINDEKLHLDNIGLVIIDEAHYNSFRKLLNSFKNAFILGVTATPLSSNIKLPMHQSYNELIVGDTISSLIDKGFLARATTYSYDVGLTSLKVGINGDYTVKSSDDLYTNTIMQEKLLHAYTERSIGKKTLIFNNGIHTSLYVYETFREAGYDIRHLDNTSSSEERKDILQWFKKTPDAILTSVGILTTGFDEPTVETIILNRATKSLTLYYQMIGRGSRKLPGKDEFTVIDLGNNAARFGLWSEPVNWQHIFKSPEFYLENLRDDTEIEMYFKYSMPPELRAKFSKTADVTFDVDEEHKLIIKQNLRSKVVLDKSLEQHASMCVDNTETLQEAKSLGKELDDDIECRIKRFAKCLSQCSKNYREWLLDDYKKNLTLLIGKKYREKIMNEPDE